MQRGTPISEKGKRDMPRRKYPPLEADADGVLWCSQCDLPPMGQRDVRGPWCQCGAPPPGSKRKRPRRVNLTKASVTMRPVQEVTRRRRYGSLT